jgi:hypothetical protein
MSTQIRIAVVASGWHFGLHFYEQMAKQHVSEGEFTVDLFCVAHRDPFYAVAEKREYLKNLKGRGVRQRMDRMLYKDIATVDKIKALGWNYVEEPNTIGDWGNTNQWLEKNDYKHYDLFLFTHDDNYILNNKLFISVVKGKEYPEWLIMANTPGMPQGNVRGSFEFFKKEMLDIMGGKFDLSETTLTREGETTAPEDIHALYDWNTTVYPLTKLLMEKNIPIVSMAPGYRVSAFCVEGERGYISLTHGANTAIEDAGFKFLRKHKLIGV